MNVIITPTYFLFVFLAVFGLVASLYFPVPSWAVAFIGVALTMFLLHEWVHVWAAKNIGVTVDTVILDIGDNITFIDPDEPKKEAMVFLAGAMFDYGFWGLLFVYLIADSAYSHNLLELTIALILIFAKIWESKLEWSDYQQYRKKIKV